MKFKDIDIVDLIDYKSIVVWRLVDCANHKQCNPVKVQYKLN